MLAAATCVLGVLWLLGAVSSAARCGSTPGGEVENNAPLQRAWRRHNQDYQQQGEEEEVLFWGDAPSEQSVQEEPQEAEAAGSEQVRVKASKGYSSHSHSHGGKRDYGHAHTLTLSPGDIAVVCAVKSPLEHIVWLRSPCPDEYDRGEVIAKGATSLMPDLFSVSVSGEDGDFTSTLSLKKPRDGAGGGVFRCEAWPHFSEHRRHRRDLHGQQESRQGRSPHDPWNAVIIGGAELIEECFYGSYGDKYRKLARSLPLSEQQGSQEVSGLSVEPRETHGRMLTSDLLSLHALSGEPQELENRMTQHVPEESLENRTLHEQPSLDLAQEIQQQSVVELRTNMAATPRRLASSPSEPSGLKLTTNMKQYPNI